MAAGGPQTRQRRIFTLTIATVRRLLASEVTPGILLCLAAVLGMLVANSGLSNLYFATLERGFGPFSAVEWVNDVLMVLFFLLVGLEIKREFSGGRLSTWGARLMPMLAAAGGMLVPALVYLAITHKTPGLSGGWAIPTATDIAFAIGILALLGRLVPPSLKLFLVTLAIIDDMGAIIIIAVAYTSDLSLPAMGAAALLLGALAALRRFGVRRLLPYLLVGIGLWQAVLLSGIHPTIAGVATAIFIPLKPLRAGMKSALHRLGHALEKPVNFLVLPVFAFANAGVSFAGVDAAMLLSPLPLGIAAGLFLGKQAGISGTLLLARLFRLPGRPAGASWLQIHGVAIICGVGFTMSLFIGGLAFTDRHLVDEVKIGVLAGSLLSALVGYLLLRIAARQQGISSRRAPSQGGPADRP